HAISCAHFLLTSSWHWAAGPYDSPETTANITKLHEQLFDPDVDGGEPIWEGHAGAEVGFDLEKAFWGILTNTMMSGTSTIPSRQVNTLPIIGEANPWPGAVPPRAPGSVNYQFVLTGEAPVEAYVNPIPIDYMAQFFTESFWTNIYPVWGPEVFKLGYRDRLLKTVMNHTWIWPAMGQAIYSKDEWWFVSFTYKTLSRNNYALLGEYLKQKSWYISLPLIYRQRWIAESTQWDSEVLMPMFTYMIAFQDRANEAIELDRIMNLDDDGRIQEFTNKQNAAILKGATQDQFQSYSQFVSGIQEEWAKYPFEGGLLLRELMRVHRIVMQDIAYLQRTVMDFLSLDNHDRGFLYTNNGAADQGPLGAVYRHMEEVSVWLKNIIEVANKYSNATAIAGHDVSHDWVIWESRMRSCDLAYTDLIGMLGNPNQWDPDDISWKRRFATVPSSYWASRMDRLRVLAHKEYLKLDHRIREVFDECEAIMERNQGGVALPVPFMDSGTTEDDLRRAVRDTKGLGRPAPPDGRYNWAAPGPTPKPKVRPRPNFTPIPPLNPSLPPLPDVQFTPSGKQDIKDVFGVPRDPKAIGTHAPRRLDITPSSLGTGNPGGSSQGEGGGQGYTRWNQDQDGSGFIQSAQRMNTVENIQGAGPFSFGTGGQFPVGSDDTIFQRRDNPQQTIFPNPYADYTITTADVTAYEQQQAQNQQAQNQQAQNQQAQSQQEQPDQPQASQPSYMWGDVWREARATGFGSDDGSDASSPGGQSPGGQSPGGQSPGGQPSGV
ncbi:hypothetical protein F5Y11DRAFT_340071, partial [Daldinia sp. FL1419]